MLEQKIYVSVDESHTYIYDKCVELCQFFDWKTKQSAFNRDL